MLEVMHKSRNSSVASQSSTDFFLLFENVVLEDFFCMFGMIIWEKAPRTTDSVTKVLCDLKGHKHGRLEVPRL